MMETFCGPEESQPIRVLQRAITKALRKENRMVFGRTRLTSVILNEGAPSLEESVGVYRLAMSIRLLLSAQNLESNSQSRYHR